MTKSRSAFSLVQNTVAITLLVGMSNLVVPEAAFAQNVAASEAVTDPAPESAEATQIKFGIEKHGAIVYTEGASYRVKCDIYQPVPIVENGQLKNAKELMPAVVMIHGGAWRAGSKIAMLRHARRLARVGYVVMAINYRLAPKYPWPAQIEDCRAALDWLHIHALEYNVDTARVGVYGYSAGAHLASMLATTNEENGPIKIRAAVVGGTPAEFSWIDDNSKALNYWLGTTRAEGADVFRDASPISHVTSDDPPLLAFHGESDMIVPVESVRRFHNELKKHNVSSKLVEVANSGHMATFSKMDLMVDAITFFDQHLRSQATSSK